MDTTFKSKATIAPDKYELAHSMALKKLKACNQRINNSCMQCNIFFDCELRKHYVLTTYQSMSKDTSGGFEF